MDSGAPGDPRDPQFFSVGLEASETRFETTTWVEYLFSFPNKSSLKIVNHDISINQLQLVGLPNFLTTCQSRSYSHFCWGDEISQENFVRGSRFLEGLSF